MKHYVTRTRPPSTSHKHLPTVQHQAMAPHDEVPGNSTHPRRSTLLAVLSN